MMYSDKVLDHFQNPRNVGEIEDANAVGLVGNAKCGDIMQMFMKIEDAKNVDVKFKTHCSDLAEQAIRAAISDYYKRQGIDPEPIVGKIEEVDHDHEIACD